MTTLRKRDVYWRRMFIAGNVFAFPTLQVAAFTFVCSWAAGGTDYFLFPYFVKILLSGAGLSGIFYFLAWKRSQQINPRVRRGRVTALGADARKMRTVYLAEQQPAAAYADDDDFDIPAPAGPYIDAQPVYRTGSPQPVWTPTSYTSADDDFDIPAPAGAYTPPMAPVSPAPAPQYRAQHRADSDDDLLAMVDAADVRTDRQTVGSDHR